MTRHIYHYYIHGPRGNDKPVGRGTTASPFRNIDIQVRLSCTVNNETLFDFFLFTNTDSVFLHQQPKLVIDWLIKHFLVPKLTYILFLISFGELSFYFKFGVLIIKSSYLLTYLLTCLLTSCNLFLMNRPFILMIF